MEYTDIEVIISNQQAMFRMKKKKAGELGKNVLRSISPDLRAGQEKSGVRKVYAFQSPCRLQNSRAETWAAVTGKKAWGLSPGLRKAI